MATRLFRHQADAVRRAAAPGTRGLLLCFGVGAGKTLTSIRAAEALMARDRRLTVVVAVPAALAINFGNELAKAGADASRFTVLTFHGFTAAYRQNPDGLRGRVLIFDEAHNLRNTSTALSKAAVGAAPSAHSVILLTGTPLQNRPADISPLLNMIRPGCLPLPQKGFEDRFGEDGLSSNLAEIRRAGGRRRRPLRRAADRRRLPHHRAPGRGGDAVPGAGGGAPERGAGAAGAGL